MMTMIMWKAMHYSLSDWDTCVVSTHYLGPPTLHCIFYCGRGDDDDDDYDCDDDDDDDCDDDDDDDEYGLNICCGVNVLMKQNWKGAKYWRNGG